MGKLFNLVGHLTSTTGTGTLTLGAAIQGHRTVTAAAIADGTVVSYSIKMGAAGSEQYETGDGTIGGSGTTMARSLIASSTGSLLNLSGTSQVSVTPHAENLVPPSGVLLPQIAVANGATTPNPGGPTWVWSTVGGAPAYWNGTVWTVVSAGGGTPAGTGTELQYRDAGAFGALGGAGGSSWTAGTKTLRLPTESKLYLHGTHNTGIGSSGDGYVVDVTNRYGATYKFKSDLILAGYSSGVRFDETTGPLITTHDKSNASSPPSLNVFSNGLKNLWLWGQYGGPYASSSNFHHGTGVSFWAGQGATPTTTNAAGGDAGNIDVWLNAGGAGNGTGAAGARGKMRVINDATDTEVWSVDQLGNMVQSGGTFNPAQYTTATRPAWSNGAVIFDTDLDKLVIGGASAWEAVTSA